MNPQRIIGLAMTVIGVGLFIVGVMSSDSFANRMSRFFTDRFTDATVWYMIVGAVLIVVGGMMAGLGGRNSKS